jgi:hypothetical protein
MDQIACPRCGGSDVRQITPGSFECESEVQTGWHDAPPSVTGAGFQRLPVWGPCGHEFQIGAWRATPSCGWPECGRDSIGTCVGNCGRRLCGHHGPKDGPFRCADCAREHALRRKREEETKQAEAAESSAKDKIALEERLAAATTAETLLQVLREVDRTPAPKAACREAWMRLVAAGEVRARHDIVAVEGHGTAPGWVLSRFGLTSQRGSWSSPTPFIEIWPSSDGAVWIDAKAVAYRRKPGEVRLSINGEPRTRYFVLPKGERMDTRRQADSGYGGTHRWFEVVNGIQVAADAADEERYGHTLTLVLEDLDAA